MGSIIKILLQILKKVSKKLYKKVFKLVKSASKKVAKKVSGKLASIGKGISRRVSRIASVFTKRGFKALIKSSLKKIRNFLVDSLSSLGAAFISPFKSLFLPDQRTQSIKDYLSDLHQKNNLIKEKLKVNIISSRSNKLSVELKKNDSLISAKEAEIEELKAKLDKLQELLRKKNDVLNSINYQHLQNKLVIATQELKSLQDKSESLNKRLNKITNSYKKDQIEEQKLDNDDKILTTSEKLLGSLPVLLYAALPRMTNDESENEVEEGTQEDAIEESLDEESSDVDFDYSGKTKMPSSDKDLEEMGFLSQLMELDTAVKTRVLGAPWVDYLLDAVSLGAAFIPVVGPAISALITLGKDVILPLAYLGLFGNFEGTNDAITLIKNKYPEAYNTYFAKGGMLKYMDSFNDNLKARIYWITKANRDLARQEYQKSEQSKTEQTKTKAVNKPEPEITAEVKPEGEEVGGEPSLILFDDRPQQVTIKKLETDSYLAPSIGLPSNEEKQNTKREPIDASYLVELAKINLRISLNE